LEAIRLGIDRDLNCGGVFRRRLEGVLARIIATRRKLEAGRSFKPELLAVRSRETVGEGVEGEGATESESSHDIRRSHKGMSARVGVITSSEVAIVRGYDYRKDEC
jgi:hypothetical protein